MTKLTDAIKRRDIATALDLINGTGFSARYYRFRFEFWHGSLLEAKENYERERYFREIDRFSLTPLQLAAKFGVLEVVNALLEQNVSLLASCRGDYTDAWMNHRVPRDLEISEEVFTSPLQLALANGRDAVATRLIDAGSDVAAPVRVENHCFNERILPPESMWLPLNLILDGAFQEYENLASLLFVAVDRCSTATLRKLAQSGAKVSLGIQTSSDFHCQNLVSYGKGSILMKAVLSRNDNEVAIIECLLDMGVDPNKFIRCRVKDTRNYGSISSAECHTALSLAVMLGKVNFARALIRRQATLWPTEFCDTRWEREDSSKNWFEVSRPSRYNSPPNRRGRARTSADNSARTDS
jgi:hypothetical protein